MNIYNVIENNITYSVKEDYDGTKYWYLSGKRHRVNGPAIECADGYRFWYLKGKLHNSNGPAIDYANRSKYWYFHGTKINCKNLKEFTKQIKLLSIS